MLHKPMSHMPVQPYRPAMRPPPGMQRPGPVTGPGMAQPGQAYPENPYRYAGYDRLGMDALSFLRSLFHQTHQHHVDRIATSNRMLRLWNSEESEIYGNAPRKDDEERLRTSQPWRIVDMMTGLVWAKPPQLQITPLNQSPLVTKTSSDLERDTMTMAEQWKWFRAWGRAVWWSVVAGVGPFEYWYDPLAGDDEPLLVVNEIDPRACVWKESQRKDGTVDYVFIKRRELAVDVLRKWGVQTLGDPGLDLRVMRDPTTTLDVYTYWAVERAMDPMTGRPKRQIVNAVFSDYGWLSEPQAMAGYTQVPVILIPGSDYPVEHESTGCAYMSALYMVEDEIKQSVRLASAMLTNAKYHTNPAYLARSNDATLTARFNPARGGVIPILEGEEISPLQKQSTVTPDVQTMLTSLGQSIQGSSIPQQLEGTIELKDISGISMSMATTGPLLRLARRQQLVQDALSKAIPSMLACLARHAMTDKRMIRIAGPDPKNQSSFYRSLINPTELMELDIHVEVKLSASLPRDTINEILTLSGLQRQGVISQHTLMKYVMRHMDLGVYDSDAEQQRIWSERLQQSQFNLMAEQNAAPSTLEHEYVPPGFTKGPDGVVRLDPSGMGQAMQPQEPLLQSPMTERQPGARYGPATHDQLTGRGSEATSNPLLLRRRSRQFIDQTGGMVDRPMPQRRG